MINNTRITAAALRGHPDLMTVKDIQNILQICRSKAYAMIQNKEIQSIRIGGVYRIPKSYLIDYLNQKA